MENLSMVYFCDIDNKGVMVSDSNIEIFVRDYISGMYRDSKMIYYMKRSYICIVLFGYVFGCFIRVYGFFGLLLFFF